MSGGGGGGAYNLMYFFWLQVCGPITSGGGGGGCYEQKFAVCYLWYVITNHKIHNQQLTTESCVYVQ